MDIAPQEYDGLFNFRDVGGIPVGPRRMTRPGILFRSDTFGTASKRDLAYIVGRLGVRLVLDLRAEREFSEPYPSEIEHAGVERMQLPVDRAPDAVIETAPSGRLLADRYLEYLGHAAPSILGAVRALAERPGVPTVVHCRAGKDRTGVVIAVVLCLLGASDELISRDYALSSMGMRSILAALRENPVYAENVRRLPAEIYEARPETMSLFLEVARERYGSIRAWALERGLTTSEIDALRAGLTVAMESPA